LRVRVAAPLADDFAVRAPAPAAVAVPFAPARADLTVLPAAEAAVLAVDVAARVLRADRAVLAAPDWAVLRVRVAPDFACVAVRPAALRVLVAVDLAADLGDEEREDVDGERLAGGIVGGS